MDFTFTPEQDEAAELAAKILGDRATNERMKAVEAERLAASTASSGPSSARPGCSGSPSRRSTTAPGSAWSSCAGCWSRSAARSHPCRWPRTAPRPGCSPSTAATSRSSSGCRARRPASGPHGGGRRGARVRTRAAHHRRDPRRRRLPPHRQQGDRPGRPVRRRLPGAGRDAGRASGVFLVEPGDEGVTVTAQRFSDGDAVARARPRRRRRSAPTGWSARPTARSTARLRHLLLLAGLRRAARHLRGRADPDRGVRQDPRAVRPPDRDLPGGLAAAGRRLHRHARPAAGPVAGRLAAGGGAAGRHRGRDRQAVGRRRRPPDRAHHRARPRRRRDRPRRRGTPLLHLGQAVRVPARRRPPSRRCTSAGRWPPSPPERAGTETVQQLLRERAEDDRVGVQYGDRDLDLARAPRRGGRGGIGR